LNAIQTNRLAKLTGVNAAELKGQSLATLADRFKWVIDPGLFGFRRICGQVVKWDPVAGEDRPVPFATVHVMDTDCDFLGYFPYGLPWAWCFPIFCHQEELATVVTDECGHFCVWVPWFDIDWVIRWRLERHCYPEIFVKPSLREILEHLGALEVAPRPGPGPDPGPNILKDGGLTIERIAAVAGRQTAMKLASAVRATRVGGKTGLVKDVLDERAFTLPMPPAHSAKLRQFQHHRNKAISGLSAAGTREYKLDLNRYVGPFPRWRCEWVIEEELVPIIDVPDITFWVTQDVDGDGDQETIYSDGYFDVGWHTGPLSDITLHASPMARPSTICDIPPVGDCGEPEILFAGLMPARAPYIDMATGYGDRPNPPHADAVVRASVFPPAPSPDTPSTAPFMGTVQLYGCNQLPGGQYYRLLYSYNGAAPVPFTNLSWWLDPFPGPGAPLHVVPDAQGWYPILADPNAWWPPNELLEWPTSQFPDGRYDITMEIGDAAKAVIFTTPSAVPFLVDNAAPAPQFLTLAWRVAGSTIWNFFPNLICPVVHRPAGPGGPVDIEFRVEYLASMPHLLKVLLTGSGCGGGTPMELPAPDWSDPPTPAMVAGVSQDPYAHWHTGEFDNSVSRAAIFSLSGSALAGAYGFSLSSYSRAFNPSGGDPADPQSKDWFYDAAWLNWNYQFLPVAVVNL